MKKKASYLNRERKRERERERESEREREREREGEREGERENSLLSTTTRIDTVTVLLLQH